MYTWEVPGSSRKHDRKRWTAVPSMGSEVSVHVHVCLASREWLESAPLGDSAEAQHSSMGRKRRSGKARAVESRSMPLWRMESHQGSCCSATMLMALEASHSDMRASLSRPTTDAFLGPSAMRGWWLWSRAMGHRVRPASGKVHAGAPPSRGVGRTKDCAHQQLKWAPKRSPSPLIGSKSTHMLLGSVELRLEVHTASLTAAMSGLDGVVHNTKTASADAGNGRRRGGRESFGVWLSLWGGGELFLDKVLRAGAPSGLACGTEKAWSRGENGALYGKPILIKLSIGLSLEDALKHSHLSGKLPLESNNNAEMKAFCLSCRWLGSWYLVPFVP